MVILESNMHSKSNFMGDKIDKWLIYTTYAMVPNLGKKYDIHKSFYAHPLYNFKYFRSMKKS